MRTWVIAAGIAAVCAMGLAAPSAAQADEGAETFKDETITPAPGDYKMVEMFLEGCAKSWNMTGPDVFRASFRDGKARKVQRTNYRKYAAELVVTDTSIKGPIVWRPNGRPEYGDYEVTINGAIKDGVISGTWELTKQQVSKEQGAVPWTGPTKGTLRGTVTTEAVLAKANALPTGKDWPQYYGPNNGSYTVTPGGTALVTDPKDVRWAWRSEEFTASGQGNCNGDANAIDGSQTQGGGASPVVSADGKLYVNYFMPAGTNISAFARIKRLGTPDATNSKYYLSYLKSINKEPDPDTMAKLAAHADDIIVCMDAATGKTLWKTVYGGRGVFYHAHKIGPVNNTPCLGGGQVYAMGCGGNLYAMDAATGKPVWMVEKIGTLGEDGGAMDRNSGNAPVFVDGVVVIGNHAQTLYGFDAATGKELWKLPGKNSPLALPARWVHGGKTYLLTIDGHSHILTTKIYCVEVKTGQVMWEAPFLDGIYGGVSVCGDIMIGLLGGRGVSDKDGKKQPPQFSVVAYRLTPEKAEPLWTVAYPEAKWFPPSTPAPLNEQFVLVPMAERSNCVFKMLDTKTGKELASLTMPEELASWNEPTFLMVEDRIILSPDGSHGFQKFGFFGATPETLKLQFIWAPSHPMTSSYHGKAMFFPWVDGRVFIRGMDGIYSYDFRRPKLTRAP